MEVNEFGYFAKTVADQLGIKSNTLGTWARELERNGIEFEKNIHKQRVYSDKDVRAFTEMGRLLGEGHVMHKVAQYIAEEMEKGRFDKASEDDNALITPSVIDDNHASITSQSRLDEFKSEIVSEMRDIMQTELSALVQHIVQQPKQHEEMLQRILDNVQTLQEASRASLNAPEGENTSEEKLTRLEANFERLVTVHTNLLNDFKAIQQENNDLKRKNLDLQQVSERLQRENDEMRKELAEKAKKGWWPFSK